MSFLYVVRTEEGDFYKVGISRNPEQRLFALQAACPLKLSVVRVTDCGHISKARIHENYILSRLAGDLTHGEWCGGGNRLLELVDQVQGEDVTARFDMDYRHATTRRRMTREERDTNLAKARQTEEIKPAYLHAASRMEATQ